MTNEEIKTLLEKSIDNPCRVDIRNSSKIVFDNKISHNIRFEGVFELDGCRFEDDVIFDGCYFAQGLSFKNCDFHKKVIFKNCGSDETISFADNNFFGEETRFEKRDGGDLDLKGCTFKKNKDLKLQQVIFENFEFGNELEDYTFEEDVDIRFRNVVFSKDFKGLGFNGKVFFDSVTFPEASNVTNCVFLKEATFQGGVINGVFKQGIFNEQVSFQNVKFHKESRFEKDTFPKGVSFEKGAINGSFQEGAFNESVIFQEVMFLEEANFTGRVFAKRVTFVGGKIKGDFNFGSCIFAEVVFEKGDIGNFKNCKFLENATFRKITFDIGATFEKSTFGKENTNTTENKKVNFEDCTFNVDISFVDSTFYNEVSFGQQEPEDGKAVLTATRFPEGANFCGTIFKNSVNFQSCTFGEENTDAKKESKKENSTKSTKCTFSNVKFLGLTYFGGATFHSKTRFHHTTFHQSVDFENTVFNDLADFYFAKFKAAQQFHLTDFMGITIFSHAIFYKEVQFLYNKVSTTSTISFQEVEFKQALDISRANFWCTLSFFGVEIEENPTEFFLYKYGITPHEQLQTLKDKEENFAEDKKNAKPYLDKDILRFVEAVLILEKQILKFREHISTGVPQGKKTNEKEINRFKNKVCQVGKEILAKKKEEKNEEKQQKLENLVKDLKQLLTSLKQEPTYQAKAYQKIRESFRIVKQTFTAEGNKIEAGKHNRNEMRIYGKELIEKATKDKEWFVIKLVQFFVWRKEKLFGLKSLLKVTWANKKIFKPLLRILNFWPFGSSTYNLIILRLNGVSNRHGTSWVRGFVFTILIACLFFGLFSLSLHQQWEWAFCSEGFGYALKSYLQFLNVTIWKYQPYGEEINGWAYAILFIGRLFVGYGIYQTVQAFRKFSKK